MTRSERMAVDGLGARTEKRDDAGSLQSRWLGTLQRDPDGRAIAFYTRRDEHSWLSRSELHARASGYRSLLEDSGLTQGDVCMIVLPSGELASTVLLGTFLAGGVPLLVAPPVFNRRNDHLTEVIERTALGARARIAVYSPETASALLRAVDVAGTNVLVVNADDEPGRGSGAPVVEVPEGGVAAMQLTSGTTGFPRICSWSQEAVLAALDGMAVAMGLSDDDVCFNWTPLYHDMGLVNNFLLSITKGIPLVMMSPHDFVRDPALWLRGLSQTGATLTWSPNFGFAVAAERVEDRELRGVRLDGVRAFWNAAERIHLTTMEDFHHRFAGFGVEWDALKTNFGCAENVGGATFSDLNGPLVTDRVDSRSLYEKAVALPEGQSGEDSDLVSVVSVGRAYPGMDIEILSPEGDPLPDGEVGEIALRTPSRMTGYVNDAPATRRAFLGDLLRTGDLGYRRGRELFWVGRVTERITVRGRKLDPSDLEPLLFGVEGLRPGCFVAFGIDDEKLGTQKAVVVTEVREPLERSPTEIIGEIRQATLNTLGIGLDDVVLVSPGTLTKTSSGKRRHRYFRSLYLEGRLAEAAIDVHPAGSG